MRATPLGPLFVFLSLRPTIRFLILILITWSWASSARAKELKFPAAKARSMEVKAVPIVFYTPENQLGYGGGALLTWIAPKARVTRPSQVLLAAMRTTRAQTILSFQVERRSAADRWVFGQELRHIDWPDRFYGVGNQTRVRDREDYRDMYWQLESEILYRPFGALYVGARQQLRKSHARDIDATAKLLRPENHFGIDPLRWSGLGMVVQWDRRSNNFWPDDGLYARVTWMRYSELLGSEFNASKARIDLRHYHRLAPTWIVASRGVLESAYGVVPFQLLAMLGGSDFFRGWFLGRFRDRALVAGEAELRHEISPLWSCVAFASIGRVASSVEDFRVRSFKAAMGTGLRFALRKDVRANFRLDIAYGDGLNVYLQFREAF